MDLDRFLSSSLRPMFSLPFLLSLSEYSTFPGDCLSLLSLLQSQLRLLSCMIPMYTQCLSLLLLFAWSVVFPHGFLLIYI